MSNLFQKLELEAFRAGINPRTQASREWFKRRVQRLTRINRDALMREEEINRRASHSYGSMFMYFYDPKHKDKLPYYDRFPLTIMVDGAKGGFYGLNLHYLNYNTRAKFLDDLMAFGPALPNESSRLTKLRYNLLSGVQKFKEFKPCFKHYLGEHVKSQFSLVPMTDWEIAIFLPVEQFKKKSKTSVWNESLKIARRP